jgi:hypothetical protein
MKSFIRVNYAAVLGVALVLLLLSPLATGQSSTLPPATTVSVVAKILCKSVAHFESVLNTPDSESADVVSKALMDAGECAVLPGPFQIEVHEDPVKVVVVPRLGGATVVYFWKAVSSNGSDVYVFTLEQASGA